MKNNVNFRIVIMSIASMVVVNNFTTHAMDDGVQLGQFKQPLLQHENAILGTPADTDVLIAQINKDTLTPDQVARLHAALNNNHARATKQTARTSAPVQQAMNDQQRQQKNNDCCDEDCCKCCAEVCCAICYAVSEQNSNNHCHGHGGHR